MAELIAQGDQLSHRWRRTLPEGMPIILGRAGQWAVPWDAHISRRHAELRWDGGRLVATQLPDAANPLFFRGKQCSELALAPGEHFVIGETSFLLTVQRADVAADAPMPVQQQSFSPQYLKEIPFRNPDHRIEVLSRLPEVISGATDDNELCIRLVGMLLAGVPRTETAAVVTAAGPPRPPAREPRARQAGGAAAAGVRVLHWDQRRVAQGDFRPSQRLILEALRKRQSILHVWEGAEPDSPQPFTARGNYDWAFCTPLRSAGGDDWALYLAGRFQKDLPGLPGSSDQTDLREDVKFTELVATIVSSLLEMRRLQQRQSALSQFFSPVVMNTLSVEDPHLVLAPRETEVSVLFCDLRGFSRESERSAGDLLDLLGRVSKALGVMTYQILNEGGVVGDFQGDAAMGFWGWPITTADDVVKTCRAALGIRAEFESAAREAGGPLAGFNAGVGIATGPAVAGKIGTVDQVKVTVFGPVVNLASRLEGMTKVLNAPILLDEATARAVREQVPRQLARVRRIARVCPFGMETGVEVSELLPPVDQYPALSDEHLAMCETALDAFLQRDWPRAYDLLRRMPTEDRVSDFLTVYIAQHNRTAPPGWNGMIRLAGK
ncbi:MAG: adenylate/guanylate cyclase domain-containing protein [Thermoguttaceae bacterium]|jgi:adenylate cyclase|nr:adenylate/guanylate cyclase domain-containing protein [Thermoguttaceae bacterium]MDI9443084.1 adenylate/guanylate cyclase domain-containing protein [Planctomycetota bacterium]